MGVDEMGVEKMGSRRSGNKPLNSRFKSTPELMLYCLILAD